MSGLSVALVGTGNVAWHLSKALNKASIHVSTIVSRDKDRAEKFIKSQNIQADAADYEKTVDSDIVFFCISDKALESSIKKLKTGKGALLVHTSGSHDLSIFQNAISRNVGVFYPFQTFTKEKDVEFKNVPIFLEARNEMYLSRLKSIARTLSNKVQILSSSSRLKLHLAGIFANNFTNLVLWEADKMLQSIDLHKETIEPLVLETVRKAFRIGPANGQTGPAARGDLEIIEKHQEFLHGTSQADLYQVLSNQIIANIGKK